MGKELTDVNGIGDATAALLTAAGFGTVKALAKSTPEELAAVQGFSVVRAARVIEAASMLLAQKDAPASVLAKKAEKALKKAEKSKKKEEKKKVKAAQKAEKKAKSDKKAVKKKEKKKSGKSKKAAKNKKK